MTMTARTTLLIILFAILLLLLSADLDDDVVIGDGPNRLGRHFGWSWCSSSFPAGSWLDHDWMAREKWRRGTGQLKEKITVERWMSEWMFAKHEILCYNRNVWSSAKNHSCHKDKKKVVKHKIVKHGSTLMQRKLLHGGRHKKVENYWTTIKVYGTYSEVDVFWIE